MLTPQNRLLNWQLGRSTTTSLKNRLEGGTEQIEALEEEADIEVDKTVDEEVEAAAGIVEAEEDTPNKCSKNHLHTYTNTSEHCSHTTDNHGR